MNEKMKEQNSKQNEKNEKKPTESRIVDIETAEDGLYCYAKIIVYTSQDSEVLWQSEGYKFLKSDGQEGFINCWTNLAQEISGKMDMPLETCVKALTHQHISYTRKGRNLIGNNYPKKLTAEDFPNDDKVVSPD